MNSHLHTLIITLIITLLLALAPHTASAQQKPRLHDVHASETVYIEGDMTPREAKFEALRRAQTAALEAEFGVAVSMTNHSYTDADDAHTHTRFQSYGLTEVRGEWVQNSREPLYTQGYDEQLQKFWYRAEVWGKARPLRNEKIDLQIHLLRNSRDDTHATTDFTAGDILRISIKSPLDGYLAMYYVDHAQQTASRMIPLTRDQQHRPITLFANKRYLLADGDDTIQLTCESQRTDHGRIYVLFSPREFALPTDEAGSTLDPEELGPFASRNNTYNWLDNIPQGKLDKWMATLRANDERLQVLPIDITIRRQQ